MTYRILEYAGHSNDRLAIADDSRIIADVYYPNALQHAHLISAAPDLLAALKLAYGSMCDAYNDFPNNPKGKLIKAAIARARGES